LRVRNLKSWKDYVRVVIRSFSFHNFILGVVNIVREHNKLTNATIVNIENLAINNSDSRPLNSHENSARWIILVIIITFFFCIDGRCV